MQMMNARRPVVPGLLTGILLLLADAAFAGDGSPQTLRITLGEYRFSPAQLRIPAGQPAILELANSDRFTSHNFTLQDRDGGLDIDITVSAGGVVKVPFTPQVPGDYVFYCNKKLPLLKSHRARGMQGTLAVTP